MTFLCPVGCQRDPYTHFLGQDNGFCDCIHTTYRYLITTSYYILLHLTASDCILRLSSTFLGNLGSFNSRLLTVSRVLGLPLCLGCTRVVTCETRWSEQGPLASWDFVATRRGSWLMMEAPWNSNLPRWSRWLMMVVVGIHHYDGWWWLMMVVGFNWNWDDHNGRGMPLSTNSFPWTLVCDPHMHHRFEETGNDQRILETIGFNEVPKGGLRFW